MFLEIIKKRRGFFCLLLCVGICLCGCSHAPTVKRVYSESRFSAEIIWENEGTEFSATLIAGEPCSDGESRDLSVEFISPDSMKGLRVERKEQTAVLTCGEISVELHNQAILRAADIIASCGSFSYHGATTLGDRELILAERVCGENRAELYIDRESGAPFRAVLGDITVDVVWFEYLSE